MKRKSSRTLVDSYVFYKKRQRRRRKRVLPYKKYMEINRLANKIAMDKALEGYHVKLPYKIGTIKIRKMQTNMNNLKLDLGHYKKTGEKIAHLNIHSDGYYPKWMWGRYYGTKISRLYKFTITEENRLSVSAIFKQPYGHKRYLE